MVEFNLWGESFIFASIYSVIIIIPCVLVALLGRKLIDQIAHFPTRAPVFHVSIFFKLVIIEAVTFTLLITFLHVFAN